VNIIIAGSGTVGKTLTEQLTAEGHNLTLIDKNGATLRELLEKFDDVKSVRWHLIGHLQTNKVRQVIDRVVMIHSVDSLKLAREIDKRAAAAGIKMDVLIEINSAMEETKSGIAAADLKQLVTEITEECSSVRVCGIMCIPPIAAEPEDSRPYFREAAELFEEMKSWELPPERFAPTELSMGMSGDFEVAIEEGATIVRVGSSIFGPRNYR
jgi:pyridoxal phosphate enzyme (YggS family)